MATYRLAAIVLLAGLAACASERVHTMSFASLREAQAAGAVERGWVPAILPAGAYELRAAYEPSGRRRWGLFNFRPDEADALRSAMAAEETTFDAMRIDIPGRIEWWPVAMRGDLDSQALSATGLRVYRARAAPLVFAVNWSQGRAYYWSVGP